MELNLTGIPMDAAEAERRGLVSKVVPADQLVDTVIAVAEKIASNSKLINQVHSPTMMELFLLVSWP
jgi:enoyl-CoA hydratase